MRRCDAVRPTPTIRTQQVAEEETENKRQTAALISSMECLHKRLHFDSVKFELVQRGVLSMEDLELMSAMSPADRTMELVKRLSQRPAAKFSLFLQALRNSDQGQIAEKIECELRSVEREELGQLSPGGQPHSAWGSLRDVSSDWEHDVSSLFSDGTGSLASSDDSEAPFSEYSDDSASIGSISSLMVTSAAQYAEQRGAESWAEAGEPGEGDALQIRGDCDEEHPPAQAEEDLAPPPQEQTCHVLPDGRLSIVVGLPAGLGQKDCAEVCVKPRTSVRDLVEAVRKDARISKGVKLDAFIGELPLSKSFPLDLYLRKMGNLDMSNPELLHFSCHQRQTVLKEQSPGERIQVNVSLERKQSSTPGKQTVLSGEWVLSEATPLAFTAAIRPQLQDWRWTHGDFHFFLRLDIDDAAAVVPLNKHYSLEQSAGQLCEVRDGLELMLQRRHHGLLGFGRALWKALK